MRPAGEVSDKKNNPGILCLLAGVTGVTAVPLRVEKNSKEVHLRRSNRNLDFRYYYYYDYYISSRDVT